MNSPEHQVPANVPVLAHDYYATETLRSPFACYTALRDAGPIVYLKEYGAFATGRHSEVKAILSDWQTFCSSRGFGLGDLASVQHWREPSVILEVDPPRHDEVKKILMKVLSNRAIRALADTFKEQAVLAVDRALDMGEVDALTDLCQAYSIKVMSDALGIDNDNRLNLLVYGSMVFNSNGPDNELQRAAFAEGEKINVVDWIMARCERDALAPGGFGEQIYRFSDDGSLTNTEATRLVRMFLSAGVDSTISGLGYTLLALARDPGQWRQLSAEPALARWAFEESIRRDPPFHTYYRTTTRDAEISGVTIPEGRKVMVSLGAAGRDPRQWEKPDDFDLGRRPTGHLAFGRGVHTCAGLAIARMQADALLGTIAEKVRSIELIGEAHYTPNNTILGLDSLPLRLLPH